ncbi:MAG: DUF2341 domain-containing protein [Kofleriaceae bacterium]
MTLSRAWLGLMLVTTACSFDPGQGTNAGAPDAAPGVDVVPRVWLEPWQHRKAITLLAAQIEAPLDGALADFPVLVKLDDADLAAGAALADGTDVAFTLVDSTTLLDREIESYAAGKLVAWVKLPSLPATTDTTIYMYYGNAAAPVVTGEAVWTEQFLAVYHMQENLAASHVIVDAAKDHDGTAEASMTAADSVEGQIGNALDFDGSNDVVDVAQVDVGAAFTISLWMNLVDEDQIHSLLANSQDGSNTNGFRFFANSNGSNDHRIRLETGNGGSTDSVITPMNAVTPGQWAHVAVVVERAVGRATIAVNGVVANENNDFGIRNDFSTNSDFEIGRMETNNPYIGRLDEVQISTTARSIEWLRTAFTNQSLPGDFYTLGDEEDR